MKSWITGTVAVALVAGGCLLAWPGPDGRHLAGLVLILAGCELALSRYHARKKPSDSET